MITILNVFRDSGRLLGRLGRYYHFDFFFQKTNDSGVLLNNNLIRYCDC